MGHLKIPDNLSKEQLINDLIKLRQRVDELEKIKEDKERYAEELNKTKAMFEGLFEFAPDAIVVVDHGGRIVQANKQAERLFGYPREELLDADHDMLVPERFRDKHLENRNTYMSAPRVRRMGTGMELYGRKKDGSEFPVDIALGPMQMGKDLVVLAVVRDFTEQKKWEKKIKELNESVHLRSQELERAYEDMKSYSYSVSHDLREPLVIIDWYSGSLMKKYGQTLDDSGREMLTTIKTTSGKMTQLIDALLSFSSISTKDVMKSDIDMLALTRNVLDDMKPTIGNRKVEFQIGDLPAAWADPFMMRQVLVNLLSNAIKYSRMKKKAVIEISGSLQGDEIVYSVKDNGSGFDMHLSDKLFGFFQRMHSSKDIEGIGIGLVIVKNIISKQGGRVWAEGWPDKGATFYFSLPKKAD